MRCAGRGAEGGDVLVGDDRRRLKKSRLRLVAAVEAAAIEATQRRRGGGCSIGCGEGGTAAKGLRVKCISGRNANGERSAAASSAVGERPLLPSARRRRSAHRISVGSNSNNLIGCGAVIKVGFGAEKGVGENKAKVCTCAVGNRWGGAGAGGDGEGVKSLLSLVATLLLRIVLDVACEAHSAGGKLLIITAAIPPIVARFIAFAGRVLVASILTLPKGGVRSGAAKGSARRLTRHGGAATAVRGAATIRCGHCDGDRRHRHALLRLPLRWEALRRRWRHPTGGCHLVLLVLTVWRVMGWGRNAAIDTRVQIL